MAAINSLRISLQQSSFDLNKQNSDRQVRFPQQKNVGKRKDFNARLKKEIYKVLTNQVGIRQNFNTRLQFEITKVLTNQTDTKKDFNTRLQQEIAKVLTQQFGIRKDFNTRLKHEIYKVLTNQLGGVSIEIQKFKQITHQFRTSRFPSNLIRLIHFYNKNTNEINTSAAAVAAAEMLSPQKPGIFKARKEQAEDIYYQLFDQIKQNCEDMGAREAANCMWSLGKAAEVLQINRQNKLFNKTFMMLCKRLMQVGDDMEGQEVANALWAMAKVRWRQQGHFILILNRGTELSDDSYTPQGIVNILWAMTTQKINDLNSIQYYVRLIKFNLNYLNSVDIAQTLQSMRKLRFYDDQLMTQMEDLFIKKCDEFNAHSLCSVALSFADLGLQRRNKVINCLIKSYQKQKLILSQDVSNFLYALTILDVSPIQIQQLIDNIIEKRQQQKTDKFKTEGFRQFRRVQLQYQINGFQIKLPPQFEKVCVLTNKKAVVESRDLRNNFRDDVFSVIKGFFPFARNGIIIENGEVQISIEIKTNFRKLAVQICNKSCYTITRPQKLLGTVSAYFELLQGLGWDVIIVSELEWYNEEYQQNIVSLIQQQLSLFDSNQQ